MYIQNIHFLYTSNFCLTVSFYFTGTQGSRGPPGVPGLPGKKGPRVSLVQACFCFVFFFPYFTPLHAWSMLVQGDPGYPGQPGGRGPPGPPGQAFIVSSAT